ncbi:hypothetical protein [Methylomonas albis]|uniref:NB-ARC domain-containing protein n=1 Tax=Methylomonas albis TaxID=1854563 RepID=A0ABR9CYN6_9GAMM|nr:SIR2 family protein [Methylomonas albis]MBD9355968.1 hypothetical protein [Methylomonas albis]CAD6879003.1 hypothetical protein [Methylomonas albis]
MQNQHITFYPYEVLVNRLSNATKRNSKRIVFLLGAPVSAPYDGSPGIANVDGMVELIEKEFSEDKTALKSLRDQLEQSSGNAYQIAVNYLIGCRGQDAVNDLIRAAVVGSCHDSTKLMDELRISNAPEDYAEQLEKNKKAWFIPNCLQDLASLCVKYPDVFGQVQLTTNFDPLLTLAIQNLGGSCYRSILSKDGSLNQVQGDGCHIIHLHGYWRGVDTLHTPRQLNQPRPKLKASLSDLLRNSIVVPIAYSGWDDVFTRTLIEIVSEDAARPEILWTYYGENDADLMAQNASQFNLFSAGLDSGRLNLYKGVDCHQLFSDLTGELGLKQSQSIHLSQDKIASSPLIKQVDHGLYSSLIREKNIEEFHSDSIPSVTDLVGRSAELEHLTDGQNKLVAIGGIGGQGKSSLAAYYALNCQGQGNFQFIEWRDCREQNDTLHNILLKTACSLIGTEDSIITLKELSIDNLAQELSQLFESRDGLIVFDNVDKYIDLNTGNPLGALKFLLEAIQPKKLRTQLVFTARPLLKFESEKTISIPLKGLSDQDVRVLFEQKSDSSIHEDDFISLINVTEGHPFWITLIASRCRQQKISVNNIINEIISGKGELPERTIQSIWNSLNDKQKEVLRTIAEIERPLPEKEVSEIDFGLNYNQFTKALKVLKNLGLVEPRQQNNGIEVLDLHPLIRRYVRTNFPRQEREKFILRIIHLFDKQILVLRERFKSSFPTDMLELWTHKIDVSLNGGKFEAAIDSLVEIGSSLIDSGQLEEYIRLSIRVFDEVNWTLTVAKYPKFDRLWSSSVNALIALGDFERADSYINRYADSIEGTGSQFINLCDTKCYRYWFEGDFEQAIFYGEQGVNLKNATNVDIDFDCSHNLALARRDNGNIDEALQFFIGQHNEDEILDPTELDTHRGGVFYGNIGRCYYFKDEIANAMSCYKKSAQLLEQAREDVLNRGYIRLWVGQALQKLGHVEDSLMFLRAAHVMWNGFIPQRADMTESQLNSLIESNPKMESIMEMPQWRLENRFQQWIKS